jgi:hypothetical protein
MKFHHALFLMLALLGVRPMAICAEPVRLAEDSLADLAAEAGRGWARPWVLSQIRPPLVEQAGVPGVMFRGTGDRNNPLRRELAVPFRGAELFVRFRLRYEPPQEEDEFFVLWLDRLDGGNAATHSNGVPNIGLHTADSGPDRGKVRFMVRIGQSKSSFSRVGLERGREHLVVGRLAKSDPDERAPYDQFDLWVDPAPDSRAQPHATVNSTDSVNFVKWIGFGTGRKTEPEDRIFVRDLVLSRSWEDVLAAAQTPVVAETTPPGIPWEGAVDFKAQVYPLLKSRCFECHSGLQPESGLRLDARNEILGHSSGDPVAEPGKAARSRLIEKIIATKPGDRMPPAEDGGPALNDREIGLLYAWIEQGLKWDESLLPTPRVTSDHWAFQPVKRPAVPAVKNQGRVRTPVDAFILAAQEARGIEPAPEADARTLERRLHLDVLGLPPGADQTDDYSALVERLLDSPHYGERWGRYWLDLARWAESHGHQHDLPRPYAWRYRDYVVQAFNSDKPYDRFLAEQIAGDELKPYADENLIATGFLAAARISGNDMDKAAQRNDVLLDIVNATGSAVMGLTLECAQCHNHKFDPISQRDYYRMQAFFVKGQLGNLTLRDTAAPSPVDLENWMSKGTYDFYKKEAEKLIKAKKFAHTTEPHTWGYLAPGTADPGIKRLPVVNRDPIVWDPETLKRTRGRIHIRGDITRPGPEVTSGWPEVLGLTPEMQGDLTRSDLVKWLTAPENPLTARVWVNRIWQWHFGRGIVPTASDFGKLGTPPSHPELLDWLAAELMHNGWSTKHIHRLILHSSTYRQQRRHHAGNAAIDPENTLLWSWPVRRLEAEAIRDAALAVSGELDLQRGGPSIAPHLEEKHLRRTLYLAQRRSEMPVAMTLFDSPELITSCPQRQVSTVALQPLYLLNSDFMLRRAQALAGRVYLTAGDDPVKQAATAFSLVLGRQPSPEEQSHAKTVLTGSEQALTHLCHALLNLNEFIYIP